MKLDEFENDWDGKTEHVRPCTNCGEILRVRTQRDDQPEYYTNVFIECSCGEWMKLTLPVN